LNLFIKKRACIVLIRVGWRRQEHRRNSSSSNKRHGLTASAV